MNWNRLWVAAIVLACAKLYGFSWEKYARTMISFVEANSG